MFYEASELPGRIYRCKIVVQNPEFVSLINIFLLFLSHHGRKTELLCFWLQANTPELKKSVSLLSLSTPNSNRKRRRLKETLAQLSRETDLSPFPPRKRPSAEHSLSIGSLLDISNTPESSVNYGGNSRFYKLIFKI